MTCTIMKPEFSPGSGVRNGGRRDTTVSTSMAMRRSVMAPISAIATASASAASATGSAWKLPPDSSTPWSANTSGLSVTALASRSKTCAA